MAFGSPDRARVPEASGAVGANLFSIELAKPVFRLAVGGGQVFSAAGDGLVRQHDAAAGRLVREYKGHGDWVYAVDYHPATGRVASGAFDGEVRVWDAATGECVCRFKAAPR